MYLHDILLDRLKSFLGITGAALDLFKSYLLVEVSVLPLIILLPSHMLFPMAFLKDLS